MASTSARLASMAANTATIFKGVFMVYASKVEVNWVQEKIRDKIRGEAEEDVEDGGGD